MAELVLSRIPGAALTTRYRLAVLAAAMLAFCVIGLGAWVRLSDAGLGCPDWPGCYGHLVGVPDEPHEVSRAGAAYPGSPVHVGKAWKEMIHRYAAGTLGLCVLAIAFLGWRRMRETGRPPTAESALLGLVALQAALGMWTVTLLLKPVIVTLHLLGGMATWATLVFLIRRELAPEARLRPLARWAIAIVFVQIALGGWVSSNYAALACMEFPSCRDGLWWPDTDFTQGFGLLRELGRNATGEPLSAAAMTAIHLAHRANAMIVVGVVGALALALRRSNPRAAQAVAVALGVQLGLGVSNVLLSLPLPVAVAHNLGAALLLATLVAAAGRIAPPVPDR